MKLISCHIENFGTLHNVTMDFQEGVNRICKENGWGKSTFAAFVRAMFYGLDGERKRSIAENERKRYKPWQGGVFGGKLRFETGGREYEICRTFGDKDGADTFELRDAVTNLVSDAFNKNIGEELFSVGRESFLRTVFIGQGDCPTFVTGDINARIGNPMDQSYEMNSYEKAYGKLSEIMNRLNPDRATGSVAKRSKVLQELTRNIREGEGLKERIEEQQALLDEEKNALRKLEKREEETQEKQRVAIRLQRLAGTSAQWENLKKEAKRRQSEREAAGAWFPASIPAEEEIREAIAECGRQERVNERIRAYSLSGEEWDRLAFLKDVFRSGTPDEAELTEMVELCQSHREALRKPAGKEMSGAEKERLAQLSAFYEYMQPAEEVREDWNRCQSLLDAIPSRQAAITAIRMAIEADKKAKTARRIGWMLLALVFFGGAVAMAVLGYYLPGLALALTAVIPIVICLLGISKDRKQKDPKEAELRALEEQGRLELARIEAAKRDTKDYLERCGKVYEESTVSAALREAAAEQAEYRALLLKAQQEDPGRDEAAGVRERLEAFLRRFGLSGSAAGYETAVYELKRRTEDLRAIGEKEKSLQQAETEENACRQYLSAFAKKFRFEGFPEMAQLEKIRAHADAYEDAALLEKEAEDALTQFEKENEMVLGELGETMSGPDPETLAAELAKINDNREIVRNKILEYNRNMEDLCDRLDQWENLRERYKDLEKEQEEEKRRYELVSIARTKLELAKQELAAKYAGPVRENFGRYAEAITGGNADAFRLDADTTITVEAYGMQREMEALSAGWKDLLGICLRFSLVDAMFPEEKPFLILDDPFANLDDGKTYAAAQLLETLGERYQVIYFTCSRHRCGALD